MHYYYQFPELNPRINDLYKYSLIHEISQELNALLVLFSLSNKIITLVDETVLKITYYSTVIVEPYMIRLCY